MGDYMGCEWPGLATGRATCDAKSKGWACWRVGRALDPYNMNTYCAQCWSKHSVDLKAKADKLYGRTHEAAGDDADVEESKRPPCPYYIQGVCRFGTSCWY